MVSVSVASDIRSCQIWLSHQSGNRPEPYRSKSAVRKLHADGCNHPNPVLVSLRSTTTPNGVRQTSLQTFRQRFRLPSSTTDEILDGPFPGSTVPGPPALRNLDPESSFLLSFTSVGKPLRVLVVGPDDTDLEYLLQVCHAQGLANAVLFECDVEQGAELDIAQTAKGVKTCCARYGMSFLVPSRVLEVLDSRTSTLVDGVQLIANDNKQNLTKVRESFNLNAKAVPKLLGVEVNSANQGHAVNFGGADYIVFQGKCMNGSGPKLNSIAALQRLSDKQQRNMEQFFDRSGSSMMIAPRRGTGLILPASSVRAAVKDATPSEASEGNAARLAGAIALIAGGTVGAGIIALPVRTAAAGFIPSTIALIMCWAYMVTTALLLVELSTWFGPGTNLVTMTQSTLGPLGKWISVGLYIFIYAATLTAYIAEGGNLISHLAIAVGVMIPMPLINVVFTAVWGGFVYLGTGPTEKINSVCLAFAIVAYAGLVSIGITNINPQLLLIADVKAAIPALPIMVVAFTFHNIVPSLLSYLGSTQQVVKAILYGSLIPLILYIVWQCVILGTISTGASLDSATAIIDALSSSAGPLVTKCVEVFSFFAIVTSFLGVCLGCVDFLKELMYGADAERAAGGQLTALSIALLPCLAVAIASPTIFYPALEFSGTFRLILFGIFPALMVWVGRSQGRTQWMPGGLVLLASVIATASGVIGIEIFKRI